MQPLLSTCLICQKDISTLERSEVHPLLHSTCWEKLIKEKEEPIICPNCSKPVLIEYKEHPALHSLCVQKWKAQNVGKALPPPKRPKTDTARLLQALQKERKEKEERLATQRRFTDFLNQPQTSIPSPSGSQSISENGEEEVKRVLQFREDYYAILCLDSTFHNDTLTTNYRKIALLVHPDKNPHTDAEAAFKLVSEAFTCLRNPEQRAKYDQEGRRGLDPLSLHEAAAFAAAMKALLLKELTQSLQQTLFNLFESNNPPTPTPAPVPRTPLHTNAFGQNVIILDTTTRGPVQYPHVIYFNQDNSPQDSNVRK